MSKSSTVVKRKAVGLVVMLALLVILDFLPRPWAAYSPGSGFFFISFWPTLWSSLIVAVAAFAGAYVARVNFAGSATVLILVLNFLVIGIAQTIAVDDAHAEFIEILSRNAPNLMFGVLGAILGAELGRWLCSYRNQPSNEAT